MGSPIEQFDIDVKPDITPTNNTSNSSATWHPIWWGWCGSVCAVVSVALESWFTCCCVYTCSLCRLERVDEDPEQRTFELPAIDGTAATKQTVVNSTEIRFSKIKMEPAEKVLPEFMKNPHRSTGFESPILKWKTAIPKNSEERYPKRGTKEEKSVAAMK